MSSQPDLNPYAPPTSSGDDQAPASDKGGRRFKLASLGARFAGSMIDGLFNIMLVFVARALIGIVTEGEVPSLGVIFGPGAVRNGLSGLVGAILPLGVMGTLIAQRSQSLGKILMGTRIVLADGRPAGLIHGFVLRTLPLTAIAYLPSLIVATGGEPSSVQFLTMLTGVISFGNAVAIFGDERRCLHDRIASTYVAIATKDAPEREGKRRKKKRRKAD